MSEVITRLKLESGEYDSKIKRATQGLLQMEEECRKVGGTLGILEKDQKQYVQSLGQMDTVSRNVRGKLAELTAAYTELSVQYKRLTDEEKQGDYGKALSSSLEQLKARIGETKGQLQEVGKEINGSDSLLEKLASKFTINIDAMKLFNAGLQAAKAALGVAQDAFFASEANVDEWGRTVESSRSLYEGFLTAINNGDISGYLSNIDQIVRAARAAYDELDKLGTMKTIQAPGISAQQTENERIRAMIQTGRYIAPQDGRRNAVFNGREMQSGDRLTAGQIKALERHLQNGMNTVVKLVGREVQQTGKAIDAYYNKIAKENGMSLQEFRKGTSSWEEFSKRIEGYEAYRKWNAQAAADYARQGGRGNVDFDKNNPYAQFRKWGNFRVDKMGEGSFNDLVSLMQQRDQQAAQAYSMQSQAYRTMNRAEGFTVRSLMNGGGGGGGTTPRTTPPPADEVIPAGSVEAATKKVQDLQKAWRLAADDDSREKINKQIEQAQLALDVLTGKVNANTLKIDIVDDKALKQLGEMDGWQFDPKTLEIVVESREAWQQLREVEGITFSPKTLPILSPKTLPILSPQELAPGGIEGGIRSQAVGTAPAFDFSKALGDMKATINAEALAVDQESFNTLLRTAVENGISSMDGQFAMIGEKLAQGINIPDSAWEAFVAELNAKREELDLPPIKLDIETGKLKELEEGGDSTAKAWKSAAGTISGVAGALNQIPDPAVKIAATIGMALANVAGAYAETLSKDKASKSNIWTFIAATAAAMVSMVSTIATIKSNTKFANGGLYEGGGFVPGNRYSGDLVPANGGTVALNSGELILNRAQQGVIADALGETSLGGLQLSAVIRGEDLKLALNNNSRRRRRGEYVTSREVR